MDTTRTLAMIVTLPGRRRAAAGLLAALFVGAGVGARAQPAPTQASASASASASAQAPDAPERRYPPERPAPFAATYADALRAWHTPEHVNAWIAERFEYDRARALALSESARSAAAAAPAIHTPAAFFERPQGVCVDLARFGVETLRAIAPELRARYLMIEFEPVQVGGQTLRRHWMALYERDGQRWFVADSARPGRIAGPFASTQDFIRAYAAERGRPVLGFREVDSFQRQPRQQRQATRRGPAADAPLGIGL